MDSLVSIIIPIYNVKEFLPKCIESVINQTYSNIEIILVNDGSPDNSKDIMEYYSKLDDRVINIYQENMGLSGARNTGLSIAKGEYICFIDGDDYVESTYVEKLYRACKENNTLISMCYYYDVVSEIEKKCLKKRKNRVFKNTEMCLRNTKPLYIVAWNKMYNRELFSDIRFPVGRIHEDVATTYKLLYKAELCTIVYEELYAYRVNLSSITRKKYSIKRLDELKAIEEEIQFFKEKNEPTIEIEIAKLYMKQLVYHINMLQSNTENKSQIDEIIKEYQNAYDYYKNSFNELFKVELYFAQHYYKEYNFVNNLTGKIKRIIHRILGLKA